MLGFTIPKIKAPAIKVNRTYTDMIGKTEIKHKSRLIEALTHDGYFVQIPYIKGKPSTLLEKLLSVFEQQFFIDDKETTKEYDYPIDNENVKTMVEILQHAASDAKSKREMEAAWWADQDEKEYERMEKEIEENKKEIEENKKRLKKKRKRLKKKRKQ
ncbi:MAG: hypothetical protein FWH18_07480 [Marinilabiliaceae bacterium]|nr:hypothetical protein [Marinilabiliaceae bacterium]